MRKSLAIAAAVGVMVLLLLPWTARLESHPLKCEACRVAVENAVFSPGTLAGLKVA